MFFLRKLIGLPVEKRKKHLFVSFAIEDAIFRDFLVKQARDERSPFDFTDMSVKEPWPQHKWKRKCRRKIKRCDCVIVLLSKNIWRSTGARWEIQCAKEEGIRVIGMHIYKNDIRSIPPELYDCKIMIWSWYNLNKMLN